MLADSARHYLTSSTELPLMSCISRISALILSLSQERIKSRMQSFLGEPPAHRAERGRVKETGLGNTLARMKREASTPAAIQLVDRISGLKQNIENTLRRGNSPSTRQVEEIVNESFAITTSDGATPFRTTLKNAGLSSRKWFNNKFIMQVDKLAAYHRIPDTLAREVHRKATRPLFSNIKIEYVDAYQPSLSPVSLTGKKVHCHVHAEVQLVIYYLQSATPLLPRFIGTSKAACFLCHLFITEHGCFEVSTWHGRLYDQWTIPDLAEYKPESVAKLRIIIQRMIDECLRLLAMMHPRHSYPLTSRHNLQEFPEFSPATTVLTAKHASRSSISQTTDPIIEATVGSPEVVDMSKPLPTISIVELDKVDSSADGSETPRQRSFGNLSEDVVATPTKEHSLASGQTSSDEWWESGSSMSTLAASNARPVQLLPDEPHFAAVPSLEIMAEIQPPAVGMMTLKTDSAFGDTPAGHVINLEELDAGQEVTFDRRENEASIVLRFQKHRREVCYVILEWA
jgi:hypothetical protein